MAKEQVQAVFRKKSLDRVNSPEQLNEYIRVANPGVWVILAAVIVLLVGVCVWGVLGHLDTVLPAAAIAKDGALTVYVSEEDIASVQTGMTLQVDEGEYTIQAISQEPVAVDGTFSEYALHVGGLQMGQWVYALSVSGDFADGVYSAGIVVESVSPMSFVLN